MSSLNQALKTLQKDIRFHDIEFVTSDGFYVSASRAILGARSQVFFERYIMDKPERHTDTTDTCLSHMTEEQVKVMVNYCYTDEVEMLTLSNAVQVARGADEFGLYGLVEVAKKFVVANLNSRRVAGKMLCEAVDGSGSDDGDSGDDKHPFIGLLRKKFLSEPIGYGELNDFSLEAMKVLLKKPISMSGHPTKAIKLFLAVVDWAWNAIGDKEMGGSSRNFLRTPASPKYAFQSPAADSLQRLFSQLKELICFIDFTCICPHYLDRIKNEFRGIPENILNAAFHHHALNPWRRSPLCPGCVPLQAAPIQIRGAAGSGVRVYRECQATKERNGQIGGGRRIVSKKFVSS